MVMTVDQLYNKTYLPVVVPIEQISSLLYLLANVIVRRIVAALLTV
jgi:hypothetical protein